MKTFYLEDVLIMVDFSRLQRHKMHNIVLLSAVLVLTVRASVERPRGVAISMASHYQMNSENTFHCLDGSKTIPFRHVNDDYCDCKDGSDEPGTSACPNGKFMCTNAGFKPQLIPSSLVNDGVCDCCDGTDEYLGQIECVVTCKELGKKYREEQQRIRQLQEEGFKKREQFSEEGKKTKEEKKAKLEQLKSEKETLDAERKDLEMKKDEAEIPEKEAKDRHQKIWDEEKARREGESDMMKAKEAFEHLDTNGDGLVSTAEMMTHSEFDIDANGVVSEEEAKEHLEESESVDLDAFTTRVWVNIKQIFKKTEPVDTDATPTPIEDTGEPLGEEAKPPGEEEKDFPPPSLPEDDREEEDEDGMDDEDDDDDKLHSSTNFVTPPPPVDTAPPRKGESQMPVEDTENSETEEEKSEDTMPEYDEETKKLIEVADEARRLFNDADSKVRSTDTEISSLESYMALDFGPDEEFAVMKGQCYEYTDREYTYKLCPFDRASQRSKHGGSETNLGVWGKWSGPDHDKYSSQLYDRGQNCWNGPDRSVKIHFKCGQDIELTNAYEPSRCEYAFDFSTPSSCTPPPAADKKQDPHDEL